MNSKIEFLKILRLLWERYEILLIKTRDNCSTRNIHDLRVAIRRLSAALDFVPSLISKSKHSYKLKLEVKKLYHYLGTLRDQQMAQQMSANNRSLGSLPLGLKDLKIKVSKHLHKVDLKNQSFWIDGTLSSLSSRKIGHFKRALEDLKAHLKQKIDQLKIELKKTSIHQRKKIHEIRRKAKIIGYHNEILTHFDVSDLTKFEKQAGHIQNLRVLKKIIRAYDNISQRKQKLKWLKKQREAADKKILQLQRNLR